MTSLAGKNVVITGAASGIGRLMAISFAERGANLAILDINKEKLDETKEEIEGAGFGVRIVSHLCDVSEEKQIDKVVGDIKTSLGQIHVLVNNAGIAPGRWITDSTYDEIKKTVDVNLLGLMWMTRQVLPDMIASNKGHIVNISSAMGLVAVPRMSDYAATKFGVIGYSDALRMELKKLGHRGVKVTVVCPSGIDTGMFPGYKSPLLSPMLKPGEVAEKVVKAIEKDKTYLKLPFVVNLVPFIKGLPADVVDRLGELLGLSTAMDHLER